MKIKKGDKVKVLSGKDRGKTGTVSSILRLEGKAIVNGVNIVTVFEKKKNQEKKGGIKKVEAPIHLSKLMLINPDNDKPSRVSFKTIDGKKVRVFKKAGEKKVIKDNKNNKKK